ncbi:MAG: alpha/beta fold hydrolase [Acidimicrobiales bacterium]
MQSTIVLPEPSTTRLFPGGSAGAPTSGRTPFGPFSLAWTESAGPRDAPRVLLLHGIYAGAHGYEWRELVPHLSGLRVRVPDLLGAGRSDRPDLAFTPSVVRACVEALIRDCGPDVHVVASSLTGAYALRAVAAGAPVASLTLVTPSGLGEPREHRRGRGAAIAYWLARHTPLGAAMILGLTSRRSVTWFQRNKTYGDPDALTPDEVDETRRAGRLPGAQHLQLAFVCNQLSIDVDPADVAAIQPLVVWAEGQEFVDQAESLAWERAGADVVRVPSGLPQVEEPADLAVRIADHCTQEEARRATSPAHDDQEAHR